MSLRRRVGPQKQRPHRVVQQAVLQILEPISEAARRVKDAKVAKDARHVAKAMAAKETGSVVKAKAAEEARGRSKGH